MKKYSDDSNNDLMSVGFDTTTFDEITEQEIREFFTKENFEEMFGKGEGNVDFESFITAAIEECENAGQIA